MEILESLFKDIGTRLGSENNLSDLTWVFAKNSKEFLQSFIDFFGFPFNKEAPSEIFREYSLPDGSRPDFAVENGNHLFVIESKIYDRNYHIEQYRKATETYEKKIVALGLIVNHKIEDVLREKVNQYHFKIETWENFIKLLETKLTEKTFDSEFDRVIKAYIQYAKEVCSIMEFKDIRFNTLMSLYYFNRLIKKIIEEFHFNDFEFTIYKLSRAFGENLSGQYFGLKRKSGKVEMYPFWGIYYGEEPPVIYFAFERDWCKDIYLRYKGKDKEEKLYYIETTNWEVSFCLNDDKFNEFNGAPLEKQKQILEDFFSMVLREITQYL